VGAREEGVRNLKLNNMKYVCAQPATQYYGWQIDTMLYSFRTVGVNLEDVHIVCAIHNEIDPYFDRLMKKYPGVIFSFYEDTRHNKSYISSIRPHILKKHFTAYSKLKEDVIFYHDSDIVFTKPLDLNKFTEDSVCYLSNTVSYIGYNYIHSKGEDVLNRMLNIVGIDEDVVKKNEINSGGAQYLLKGIDKYFWYDVENDSTRLFEELTALNQEKKSQDPNYHELQIWCADMWGVLWNLWKKGKETRVIQEMDFSWATSNISEWHKNSIYHNAGVTEKDDDMFFKGDYIEKIPLMNLDVSKQKCSYSYYKLIQQSLI
jgi:hypothetical protein